MSNGRVATLSTNADNSSHHVPYPIEATEGSTVTVDGSTYIVQPAVSSGDSVNATYTLTNKKTTPTKLKVEKRFLGTDSTTLPSGGIRIKLQQAHIATTNGDGKTDDQKKELVAALTDADWTDVTVDGQGTDGWYVLKGTTDNTTTKDGVTTWTHTFENLAVEYIDPTSHTVTGTYVYRVIEAAGSGSDDNAVSSGTSGSATYGDNSYIVQYSGDGWDNWEIAEVPVTDKDGNTTVPTAVLSNQLIVHLPSTGSHSAMTLTILSLICLAAAGSFGIFGRKKYIA